MEAPNGTLRAAQGMIVLNELRVHANFRKAPLAPAFAKEATVISKPPRRNQQNTGQPGLVDNHFNLNKDLSEQLLPPIHALGNAQSKLINKPESADQNDQLAPAPARFRGDYTDIGRRKHKVCWTRWIFGKFDKSFIQFSPGARCDPKTSEGGTRIDALSRIQTRLMDLFQYR